jgi:hypothetical protein
MSRRKWLILTALAMEAKAVLSEFRPGLPEHVNLSTIGIEGRRLDQNIFRDVDGGVILAGLAGALDPALKVGDIVFEATADRFWGPLPFRQCKIHTSDHLISLIAEKQKLFIETGCAAVDMEGAIVRKLAESAGLPMLHIRAIGDSAAEALPERMMNWIDDLGEPIFPRLAADMLLFPSQISTMMRLGKNSRLALHNLAPAVRQIVQSRTDP